MKSYIVAIKIMVENILKRPRKDGVDEVMIFITITTLLLLLLP